MNKPANFASFVTFVVKFTFLILLAARIIP